MQDKHSKEKEKEEIEKKEQLTYKEIKGNLFTANKNVSLAHCVSRNLRMGKGIALTFKNKFGCVKKLKDQNKNIGEMARLKGKERYIYYLITKELHWHKPTYKSLESSLIDMRKHIIKHKVKNLAMPKIGCGLDRLDWNEVKKMINKIFKNDDISITIYYL